MHPARRRAIDERTEQDTALALTTAVSNLVSQRSTLALLARIVHDSGRLTGERRFQAPANLTGIFPSLGVRGTADLAWRVCIATRAACTRLYVSMSGRVQVSRSAPAKPARSRGCKSLTVKE
jgi:hypothetical protein